MKTWNNWSTHEIRTLNKEYEAGTTYSEIAKLLGRSYDAVCQQVKNCIKAKRKARWSEAEIAALTSMCSERLAHKVMARKLDRSVLSVSAKIRTLKELGKI